MGGGKGRFSAPPPPPPAGPGVEDIRAMSDEEFQQYQKDVKFRSYKCSVGYRSDNDLENAGIIAGAYSLGMMMFGGD